VAAFAVACLTEAGALNRSLDVISLPAGEGSPTTDWSALLNSVDGSCDYSINSQWGEAEVAKARSA